MGIVAIIPARAGSKRIAGKNLRPFLGTPLIRWTIDFALSCGLFDRIVLTTDGDDIAACGRAAGIVVIDRDPALATDTAATADVVIDALDREAAGGHRHDVVALLQPTSPIRLARRWHAARAALDLPGRAALVGVSPVSTHPFHSFRQDEAGRLTPWEGPDALTLRSQDLPAATCVNGSLYLLATQVLRDTRGFFPDGSYGILCHEPVEAIDLDTEADWIQAEALAGHFLELS